MESGTPPGRKPVRLTGGCFAIETLLTRLFNTLFAVSRIDFNGFRTAHSPLLRQLCTALT